MAAAAEVLLAETGNATVWGQRQAAGAAAIGNGNEAGSAVQCAQCGEVLPLGEFSASQLGKGARRRCSACVAAPPAPVRAGERAAAGRAAGRA